MVYRKTRQEYETRCIPCDNYVRLEDNLAAIAATLDALRTIERHGSAMFEAAFTGFTALPSPDAISKSLWRAVLYYSGYDLKELELIYKAARSDAHPDKEGGDSDRFNMVNEAWKQAQLELTN